MRKARHDHTLIRFDAIPDPERKFMHRRAAMLASALNDLVLEGIVSDASQSAADLFNEAVAEAPFARLVVILRAGNIRLSERRDSDRVAQGAG